MGAGGVPLGQHGAPREEGPLDGRVHLSVEVVEGGDVAVGASEAG